MKYSLLLVEDEAAQLKALQLHLMDEGYEVFCAGRADEAMKIARTKTIDIVITDYNLPGGNGQYLLEQVKAMNPLIPVIMITAYGSIDSAVAIMKAGAFDYLSKPINIEKLLFLIGRACELRNLSSENIRLREELGQRFSSKGIIAKSGKMEEVLNIAARVAPSKASVLLRGESGTGKEIIAKMIHYASPRRSNSFVAFNVAALSPGLIENELFGHERGAFTGANQSADGRFQQAHRGTLFIDEIGDIPIEVQNKFLRVLEESTVERIGGGKPTAIDIRVIAATNKNLEEKIKEGSFREDLYYRLNVVSIIVPPLRERKEDILPLCELFIGKYAAENCKEISGVSREALDTLLKYNFPGNVRELENMVERAVVLTRGNQISVNDLPPTIFATSPDIETTKSKGLGGEVEKLEKYLILSALRKSGDNQSRAARELQISERRLRYKMQKYGFS